MNDKKAIEALKAAFPNTLPILAGFIVLGMGYGIYLRSSGLPVWYPTLTSIVVFGGSLEFLLVSMLLFSQSLFSFSPFWFRQGIFSMVLLF